MRKIAVLGTGAVGRALAARLAELGHDVRMGTRDVAATLTRDEQDAAAMARWLEQHPAVRLMTFDEAADGADLLINATAGTASLAAMGTVDERRRRGAVVLDVANALDFSHGFPPRLAIDQDTSLAEQLQAEYPEVRVVKALSSMNASVMVHPERVGGGDHTTFVAGNDEAAKAEVIELLTELGHQDMLDLGDLTAARGVEAILPLWLRLLGALGTPNFQFKVVR
jgi:hypothetical protein